MTVYLGAFPVALADTPYANYTPNDWVMQYMFSYGQIDGAHHKQWVLDQIARILKGTPVLVDLRKWDNGHSEFQFYLDEPSSEYLNWVKEYRGEWDEENECHEYEYDEGIAP